MRKLNYPTVDQVEIAAAKESLAYVEKWIARNLAEPRKE